MSGELVEIAILAYRNGRYKDATELFLQVIDGDAENWMARLYLGMSYQKVGQITDAHRLFKRMVADCPDDHMRSKAENALPLVEAEMRRRFMKDNPPAQTKRAALAEKRDEDLVWVNTAN